MKLSVIIPAHNEERNISTALEKISDFLDKKKYEYEIIVSEDGSVDKTLGLARKFADKNRRVKVLHSAKRLGKGGGIIRGFKEANGDIVAFIDADLSANPTELEKVVNAIKQGNDIAIASRHMKQSKIIKNRPFLRRIAAKGINIISNSMFDISIHDTQCGLKALSRDALKKILPQMTRKGFEFDVELLLRAKNFGMKIKEVPIIWEHKQETAKISGFPARTATKTGIGLLNLWIKNSFNRNDLFFFLFLALFAAISVPFLGNYIGADEGTHLTIAAFYFNFFRDFISNPTFSFSKIYNYAIAYLVHYPKLSLYYPPAFHSAIAILSYLFGMSSFTGAATGLLFGVLTILAIYYFGRKFIDRNTAIVSAILFALVPQVFILSIKAMLDLTFMLFFILSLALYLVALRTGKTRKFIYAAIVLSIGFLFKQNIVLLAPVIFLYTMVVYRKYVKHVVLSLLLSAIIVAPYVLAIYKLGLISVMLQSSLGLEGYVSNNLQFNTFAGWLYYPTQLGSIYFSYPVFIATFIALLYYSWKREKHWQLFLAWFLTLIVFFVFVPNKQGRYILPAIPSLIFPLAFYITKLPKIKVLPLSILAFSACAILIIYTSYTLLAPSFYYNTDYFEVAASVMEKKGNVLLTADSDSFYTSAFIFEVMRLDNSKEKSVLRPCILGARDINSLINENGVRYAIVPDKILPTSFSNTSAVTSNKAFQPIKNITSKGTTLTIYENINYVPQKENCNYVCITNQWICSNYTYPSNALR
jgi:glycosyltransferase involved in cell wall biosynthesis